jgi:hypothetical protein
MSKSISLLFICAGLVHSGTPNPQVVKNYGKLPLTFEKNVGQIASPVHYLSAAATFSLYLGSGEAWMHGRSGEPVHMRFGRRVQPEGIDELGSKSNYFIGRNPEQWRTNVPHFNRVRYRAIYPGIDLVYHGSQQQLEFDFVVAPGADPQVVRLSFDNLRGLRIDKSGDLVLKTRTGEMRQHKPVIYQEVDGQRKLIAGRFVRRGKHDVGFTIGEYDRSRELVIDPVLSYSTYLGGSEIDEATAIAVDNAGNAYIAGYTHSTDFPTFPAQTIPSTQGNVFVTKLNASGTGILYSTYLGGIGNDFAFDVAVDAAGSAYITGGTQSSDFPTTPGSYKAAAHGDIFVAKFNPAGGLVYATGIGDGIGNGIAVGPGGNAYITGTTYFPFDFPVTAGAYKTTLGGYSDAFVTELNASGSALVFSTLFGGNSGWDSGYAIALDAAGQPTITGDIGLSDFNTTPGAFQRVHKGGTDVFVARLNATGTGLIFSTLLGSYGLETGYGIALDASGATYVTGRTSSHDFPTTPGIPQELLGSGSNFGFLTKLNTVGSLVFSTSFPIGGLGMTSVSAARWVLAGLAVGVDGTGGVYVTGGTYQAIPGSNPSENRDGSNAFLLRFTTAGSMTYGAMLAGSKGQYANDLAIDGAGNVYVVGHTYSTDFPTVSGSYRPVAVGGGDGFAAKINMTGSCTYSLSATSTGFSAAGGGGSLNITAPAGCSWLALPNAPWITITSASSASGSGTLTYSVSANDWQNPRTAAIFIGGQIYSITQAGMSCTYSLNPTSASFTFSGGNGTLSVHTPVGCSWSASSPVNWITLTSGANGSGPFTVSYSVQANNTGVSRTATLTIAGKPFTVTQSGMDVTGPFGFFDTPANNATNVVGAIPVTGWALDQTRVASVQIFRDSVPGEPAGLIYIGDAVFVDGARPDISAAHPTVPFNTRGGWGYLMLTNMLPNANGSPGRGNGTYRIHAIATDILGNKTALGVRTITCTNASATKPFGSMDTPASGGTASGPAYVNFGWALTPQPYTIPVDASTIWVFVDGQPLGHPVYNQFRPDIAGLFPGLANSNGAVGAFILNTTTMTNGLHSIAWSVTDNGGRIEGIGSRLFTVANSSPLTEGPSSFLRKKSARRSSAREGIWLRTGYNPESPLQRIEDGAIQVEQAERIELHLPGEIERGCLLIGDECRDLPVGSTLDRTEGIFYWGIDPAFLGAYTLRFEGASAPAEVQIAVHPQGH